MGGAQRRLIVVSNRGPVTYDRDEQGVRVARRGGGGLVTALRSLAAREDVSWIASAISDEDRIVAAEGGAADGLRLLAHDAAAYDLFYNVVANPLLWFVQHELWDPARPPAAFGRLEQGWRDGYTVVNQAFADAVCEELETHPDAGPVVSQDSAEDSISVTLCVHAGDERKALEIASEIWAEGGEASGVPAGDVIRAEVSVVGDRESADADDRVYA